MNTEQTFCRFVSETESNYQDRGNVGSLKSENFFDKQSDYQLLKKRPTL